MLETICRPSLQVLFFDKLVNLLAKLGAKPWHLTLLALLSGLMICPAIAWGFPIVAILLMGLSGLLDVLDGSLARVLKVESPLGSFLDILADRIVETSIIIGLYLYAPEYRGLQSLLMLGSVLVCVTSFLMVGIHTPNEGNKSFYYHPGLIERAEAFIFFTAMITFPHHFDLLAWAFIALVGLTTVIRSAEFMAAIRSGFSQ